VLSSKRKPRKKDNELRDNSYAQILKSTFVMGGSSIVNIFLGIVRHKVIALLLNPSGMGLLGIYQSITNLTSTVSGIGINESGARQVALAFGTGDDLAISRTYLSLRRIAFFTGICGSVLLLFSSKWVSLLTFNNSEHALDLVLLSVTLFFGAVSGGQLALIQGTRQINYLAKINVLGPFWGTILSIPIIYYLGMKGIVSYLIIMSATNIITSWWYSKKIKIIAPKTNWRKSLIVVKPLLTLGTAFMLGNLISVGANYLLRVFVIRNLGLDAAGEYQASTILSSVYVGILMKAMATDFYPRLSAASYSDQECCILVNKQIETGLLLAVPGVLATLTFAPLIIVLFYSSKFMLAVDLLRWQILGVFLQIITWPMGYILRAKGDGRMFIATELFGYCVQLILAWIGIRYFGLAGIGMAFFAMNAAYLILIYRVVSAKYRFSIAIENIQILIILSVATIAIFVSPYIIPSFHVLFNSGIIIVMSLFSLKKIISRIGTLPILSYLSRPSPQDLNHPKC